MELALTAFLSLGALLLLVMTISIIKITFFE